MSNRLYPVILLRDNRVIPGPGTSEERAAFDAGYDDLSNPYPDDERCAYIYLCGKRSAESDRRESRAMKFY